MQQAKPIILTPAQDEIAKDTHRFRVVVCGRRFGKTTLAVLEMVARAVYKTDCRIAYISPTYQMSRDIAWLELKKICKPIVKKINESRLEIQVHTVHRTTSTISLRGWESIDTLRGQLFDFIVIDEIASMRNWESNWQEIIRPTLTDRRGEVLFITTPKGFNHAYSLYCTDPTQPKAYPDQKQDQDYKSFHFTSYENPHLPKEEIDKAAQELTPNRFAQEYLADFKKQEGLVYQEFIRDQHLFNTPMDGEHLAGVDFGFTNPTAVLTIIKDYDASYWVTKEWYHSGKTNDEIAEYVASQKFSMVYSDPASPAAIQEFRRRGINVRDVIKGKDSIKNGIDKIKNLFLQNRLHIHQSCTNLIGELESYSYPESTPNKNEDEVPIDDNNHALDALSYCIRMNLNKSGKAQVRYPSQQTPTQLNPLKKLAHVFNPFNRT